MQVICQTHGMGEGDIICSKCLELVEEKINNLQQLQSKIDSRIKQLHEYYQPSDQFSRDAVITMLHKLSSVK